MGSGKSTIGKLLAKTVSYQFLDLDEYIENKEDASISEIFDDKGEIHFRKIEHTYLKDILSNTNNIVLSLGGGTPCYANNMQLIRSSKNTISFYLKASINELVNRLENEKNQRPLVARFEGKEELKEFIGKHLFERNHFYNLSDVSVIIDEKSKEKIIEEILFNLY